MGDTITAFELIGRQIVEFLLSGVPGHDDPLRAVHPWYVLMDVSSQGAPGTLAEPFADALAAAMEKGLVHDAIIASSAAQAARLWQHARRFRRGAAEGRRHRRARYFCSGVEIPAFVAKADAALRQAYPGIAPSTFGHVGDGNLHYNMVRPLNWDA